MKILRNKGPRLPIVLGLAWGITVVIGLCILNEYRTTASDIGTPAERWPTVSRIIPPSDRAQLVMAVHPRCPCSRASLRALARIMANSQDRVAATVLFLRPSGVPVGWEQTDLWHSSAAIPGVQVVCDDAGREAAAFGAESSGHVLLYDRQGRRIFSGGITAGRGHDGDNAGFESCLSLIHGEKTSRLDASVYGCSLLDPPARRVSGVEPSHIAN
jgi:hypothetical protein